jgi:DNA-binding ferritin-like protein (Dps family)
MLLRICVKQSSTSTERLRNVNDELKLLIAAKLDVTDFLDIIGYDLADLLEVLGDEIEENYTRLMAACE